MQVELDRYLVEFVRLRTLHNDEETFFIIHTLPIEHCGLYHNFQSQLNTNYQLNTFTPYHVKTLKMCIPTLSNETVKAPKRVHCKALSTKHQIVPTFPVERAPQHMDVSDLTSSDLASLKRNDPFMYYSIPSAKNAALHCEDVSMFVGLEKSKRNSSTALSVTRQRRISTECHPDLLLEKMFADTNFMASLKDLDSHGDDCDDLYDFLLSLDETPGQR